MTMVRKQVYITSDQNRRLKLQAEATGRPEAELIRSGIDRVLGGAEDSDDWKSRIMTFAGALADEEGIEQRVAEQRQRLNARLDANLAKLKGAG